MGQMRNEAKFVKEALTSPIRVNIRADRALFTRPEMTVERYSYDVPTCSAMKGVLRSIYNHAGMDYKINNIYVCRKIKRDSVVRNETKLMQNVKAPEPFLLVNDTKNRTLRGTTFLVNVEYVVEAEIIKKAGTFEKNHTLPQFYDMFMRRLYSGGNQRSPWLGCREFHCYVKPYTGVYVKSVYAGKKLDLGIMYQDTKVDENGTEIPLFADTTLEDGRLVFKGWFSNVKGSEDV